MNDNTQPVEQNDNDSSFRLIHDGEFFQIKADGHGPYDCTVMDIHYKETGEHLELKGNSILAMGRMLDMHGASIILEAFKSDLRDAILKHPDEARFYFDETGENHG